MTAVYTPENLIAVLDNPLYNIKPTRSGYQVNLVLPQVANDEEKCALLLDGKAKLVSAGFDPEDVVVKISTPPRGGQGPWKTWPCLFVNRPAVAGSEDARKVANAEAIMAAAAAGCTGEQLAAISRSLGAVAEASEQVVTTTDTASSAEPDEVI